MSILHYSSQSKRGCLNHLRVLVTISLGIFYYIIFYSKRKFDCVRTAPLTELTEHYVSMNSLSFEYSCSERTSRMAELASSAGGCFQKSPLLPLSL